MRFVIQRVTESEVRVDNEVIGKIGKGFMVLVGVSDSDTKEIADKMIRKMLALRIFEDEQGKTNLSLDTVGGELLLKMCIRDRYIPAYRCACRRPDWLSPAPVRSRLRTPWPAGCEKRWKSDLTG